MILQREPVLPSCVAGLALTLPLSLSRDVRRAALFNLIPSPKTLPALISRTLDVDPINRRASFAHVLIEVPCASLNRAQREETIGRGLRDREEGVQRAAKKLIAKWADECGGAIIVSRAWPYDIRFIAADAVYWCSS